MLPDLLSAITGIAPMVMLSLGIGLLYGLCVIAIAQILFPKPR
jgi:K+-transporting ATPase c subunit